jgi:hypothetical protein
MGGLCTRKEGREKKGFVVLVMETGVDLREVGRVLEEVGEGEIRHSSPRPPSAPACVVCACAAWYVEEREIVAWFFSLERIRC